MIVDIKGGTNNIKNMSHSESQTEAGNQNTKGQDLNDSMKER